MRSEIVLIIGISGFTGYYMYRHLKEINKDLVIFGVDKSKPLFNGDFEFSQIDIMNFDQLNNFILKIKPTYIFHLAALNFSQSPKFLYTINILGTINLLKVLKNNKNCIDPKVLIVGSSAEYGIINKDELPISENNPLRPISHYGVSKVAQDLLGFKYYKNFGLKTIRVRPFNLIGPGQSSNFICGFLAKKIDQVKKGLSKPEISIGNLKPKRDFIDVRDVVRAYWELMSLESYGNVYNIGSGKCYSIKEILNIFFQLAEIEIEIKQEKQKMRESEISIQISSIDKIRKETEWTPKISLEESLRDMLDFF